MKPLSDIAKTLPPAPVCEQASRACSTAFHSIRQATLALTETRSAEDCVIQSMPDASPVKWHLAHTTWFFEAFVLTPHPPKSTRTGTAGWDAFPQGLCEVGHAGGFPLALRPRRRTDGGRPPTGRSTMTNGRASRCRRGASGPQRTSLSCTGNFANTGALRPARSANTAASSCAANTCCATADGGFTDLARLMLNPKH